MGSGLRCSGGSVYDATGDVRYNGSVPSPTTVRQAVGYVQQQDFLLVRTQSCGRDLRITPKLDVAEDTPFNMRYSLCIQPPQPSLSVRETLHFSALMRLPRGLRKEDKLAKVESKPHEPPHHHPWHINVDSRLVKELKHFDLLGWCRYDAAAGAAAVPEHDRGQR